MGEGADRADEPGPSLGRGGPPGCSRCGQGRRRRRALAVHSVVVHLDVDVIDFTDAPLSENAGRNTGLSFRDAALALRALLADEGLVALTVVELNPAHAIAEAGLLERFAAALADAIQR